MQMYHRTSESKKNNTKQADIHKNGNRCFTVKVALKKFKILHINAIVILNASSRLQITDTQLKIGYASKVSSQPFQMKGSENKRRNRRERNSYRIYPRKNEE